MKKTAADAIVKAVPDGAVKQALKVPDGIDEKELKHAYTTDYYLLADSDAVSKLEFVGRDLVRGGDY